MEPVADHAAAATVRASLQAVRYDEKHIVDLLGDDGPGADAEDVVVFDRRLPASTLATAVRLLLLQLAVPERELAGAFGDDGVGALIAIGLARRDGELIEPQARIMPAEGLLLACDAFPRGAEDPPGYVAAYTPTASWCAALTPRPRRRRALDVGTGNGAQALLAARHCDHVIATDVNPRALAYASLNAALNGLDNVEARLGSLFEPVAGDTFDLITCNAPYVISPETKWQYRDGGLPADEFSARVVAGAAEALADGGYATLLVSWLAESEDEPDGRVNEWLRRSGCDAWVLGITGADPLEHAATWNDHLTEDDALGEALDTWTEYFRDLGVGWITEGAVLLHRRNGGRPAAVRADPVSADELEAAGAQIERAFAAQAFLAEADGDDELLDTAFELAETVRLEERLDPHDGRRESRLLLDEGTYPDIECPPAVAAALAGLDGSATLRESIARAGLPRRAEHALTDEALEALTDLLELGFVEVDGT
ncbi:MAG TPA: methyltransferase [Gaiellaceae bacterium]|nr:methyltransferase [Gaiellaceae bacterium]